LLIASKSHKETADPTAGLCKLQNLGVTKTISKWTIARSPDI